MVVYCVLPDALFGLRRIRNHFPGKFHMGKLEIRPTPPDTRYSADGVFVNPFYRSPPILNYSRRANTYTEWLPKVANPSGRPFISEISDVPFLVAVGIPTTSKGEAPFPVNPHLL